MADKDEVKRIAYAVANNGESLEENPLWKELHNCGFVLDHNMKWDMILNMVKKIHERIEMGDIAAIT